ncbi:MAG: YggS family pyridoxal phosphate-dependent enzyme [Lentisphaeria bacterium]|nr:YggS family pyridoxal phosphate-dependent enzyme [Lentisphaeria bacterium]
MTDIIVTHLNRVRDDITRAADSAGRDPASVRLLAVSKTLPADVIRRAYDAGQRLFGENRVQDLCGKCDDLPPDCEWHFIGPLQKNKVRQAVRVVDWVHSLDSVSLVERVNRIAAEENRSLNALVQVNISGEVTKHGCAPAAAAAVVEAAARSPRLTPRGLMTIAPWQASEEELRRVFRGLRVLRDTLEDQTGLDLPELSMGMSGDFPIAIAEGATLVRIGTAIFGPR